MRPDPPLARRTAPSLALLAALAAPLPLLAAAPAAADEVWLKNGSSITGRASTEGADVVVVVKGGRLRIPASSVDRIDRGPLPDELFAERAARTDLDDPGATRALARYARELGMTEAAAALERTADEVDFERRVAGTAPDDAAGFRGLAWLARSRGLGREVERYLYGRALQADADDEDARRHLERLDAEERDEARRRREEAERAERERAAAERAALERALAGAREEAALARAEAERERERRRAAEREAPSRPELGPGRGVLGPGVTIIGGRRRGRGAVIITGEGPVFVPRGTTYPPQEK
jgi:hypothetical protein